MIGSIVNGFLPKTALDYLTLEEFTELFSSFSEMAYFVFNGFNGIIIVCLDLYIVFVTLSWSRPTPNPWRVISNSTVRVEEIGVKQPSPPQQRAATVLFAAKGGRLSLFFKPSYPKSFKYVMWKTIWNQNQPLLVLIEGSLEVKLPTIWTDEEMGRVREEKRRRKKIKKDKVSEERSSRCV